jgi:hypothetical protein
VHGLAGLRFPHWLLCCTCCLRCCWRPFRPGTELTLYAPILKLASAEKEGEKAAGSNFEGVEWAGGRVGGPEKCVEVGLGGDRGRQRDCMGAFML